MLSERILYFLYIFQLFKVGIIRIIIDELRYLLFDSISILTCLHAIFLDLLMNLKSLDTLRAILLHGSFTAAGEVVGCSPSAVSLQIKQLEEYFGKPLFDRSTRVVRPTPFAREIAIAASEFSMRINALRTTQSIAVEGRIRLGVITSMQSTLLPHALLELRRQHPALEIRIPPLNDTNEILTELKAGRIEMALLVRPEKGGSQRLIWKDITRQQYVMLAPPGSAEQDPRKLIRNYGWVAYDTSLQGGLIAARYIRSIVPNQIPNMELRSTDALVSMVSLGLGVTVLPLPRKPIIDAYGLREIDLGVNSPRRRIALAWRKVDNDNRKIIAVANAFVYS